MFYPIAEGTPVVPAVTVQDATDHEPMKAPKVQSAAAEALQALDMQFPEGLCKRVMRSAEAHPMRMMILDNSGSMQSNDGQRFVAHNGAMCSVRCSRWAELCDDVLRVAEISAAVGARTDMMLLNPHPGFSGTCSISTDSWDGIKKSGRSIGVPELRNILHRTQPSGSTPLTEAVMKVVSIIQPCAAKLRAAGQTVSVLLCTDGLPNNKHSFLQAMQALQQLPVWCVVRLCTNDDSVVSYWNELDAALEAPLEVLDDVRGEAAEIRQLNPWLTYAPSLHMCRLFGMSEKVFDALDEMRLMPSQISDFLQALLGIEYLPEPELDKQAFLSEIRSALNAQPHALDPSSGRLRPWVDMAKLERALDPKRCDQPGCLIM